MGGQFDLNAILPKADLMGDDLVVNAKFYDADAGALVDAQKEDVPVVEAQIDKDGSVKNVVVGTESKVTLSNGKEVDSAKLSGYATHDTRSFDPVLGWAVPTKHIDYLAKGYTPGAKNPPLVDAWHVGITMYSGGVQITGCDVVIPLPGSGATLTPDVEAQLRAVLLTRFQNEIVAYTGSNVKPDAPKEPTDKVVAKVPAKGS